MIWEAVRTGLYGAIVVWAFLVAIALPLFAIVVVVDPAGRERRARAEAEGRACAKDE